MGQANTQTPGNKLKATHTNANTRTTLHDARRYKHTRSTHREHMKTLALRNIDNSEDSLALVCALWRRMLVHNIAKRRLRLVLQTILNKIICIAYNRVYETQTIERRFQTLPMRRCEENERSDGSQCTIYGATQTQTEAELLGWPYFRARLRECMFVAFSLSADARCVCLYVKRARVSSSSSDYKGNGTIAH